MLLHQGVDPARHDFRFALAGASEHQSACIKACLDNCQLLVVQFEFTVRQLRTPESRVDRNE